MDDPESQPAGLRRELMELSVRHRVLRTDHESSTLVCAECGTVGAQRSRAKENKFNRIVSACPNELEERREAANRWTERQAPAPALSAHWTREMRDLYRDTAS